MNEPDWDAIAGQLAREVRGWELDGDFWVAPDDPLMWMYTIEAARAFAKKTGCPVEPGQVWQPHLDIGQAMRVLDAVIATPPGFDANVDKHHHSQEHQVWIVPAECRRPCWVGFHAKRAKAICAAAKSWVDAQKGEL